MNSLDLLLFYNVQHSSAGINLHVGPIGLLLHRILVSIVGLPRATVRIGLH